MDPIVLLAVAGGSAGMKQLLVHILSHDRDPVREPVSKRQVRGTFLVQLKKCRHMRRKVLEGPGRLPCDKNSFHLATGASRCTHHSFCS